MQLLGFETRDICVDINSMRKILIDKFYTKKFAFDELFSALPFVPVLFIII